LGGDDEGTGMAASYGNDAIYYLFTCNDYVWGSGPYAGSADDYFARGRTIADDHLRVNGPFFDAMPCAFWPRPAQGATPPVPPLALPDVPTLVVNATGDAETPVDQAETVYRRLDQGSLVEVDGGEHIVMTDGIPCAESLVAEFLVSGTTPAKKE